MLLVTPPTIRTLLRKLYRKAKQEPACRFYALYDKISRQDILGHAWRLVRANRGGPGIDGVSFESLERDNGVQALLEELAQDLKEKTCRAQAVRRVMIQVVRHVLARLDLSLNEAKTRTVDATRDSFNFLGFSIRMTQGRRPGKPYPHVSPSDKALMKIKTRLTELTGRQRTPIALEEIVGSVNRSLRGWINYFQYRNSTQAMEKVNLHAEERIRTHLMKRHKVKARRIGEGRLPSAKLYARYGLYKISTVAGWKSAHA